MDQFLKADEFKALEEVLEKARAAAGTHRAPTSDGEAIAYQHLDEIRWFVNSRDANVARGAVPLKRP